MSDIRQMFSKPKKRARNEDESVPRFSVTKEPSADISLTLDSVVVTSESTSCSIALLDDELPDDIIDFESNVENLDESQVGNYMYNVVIVFSFKRTSGGAGSHSIISLQNEDGRGH